MGSKIHPGRYTWPKTARLGALRTGKAVSARKKWRSEWCTRATRTRFRKLQGSLAMAWLWRVFPFPSLRSFPSFLPSLQAALLPSFSLSFPSHLRMRSSPFILLSSKYSASHPLPDTNRSPSNDSSTIRMYRCRLDGWMNSSLFPFSFKPTVRVPHHA